MPDLISIANDLKTAPDQWLVQQSQKPSGTTPPYLVLAELQRRQLLRGGSTGKPPSTSVAQDTIAATIKQIAPPKPEGPPPPPGMAPPTKGMPSGQPGGPMPGAKPPQNMAAGGAVKDDEEEEDESVPELIRFFSEKYGIDPQIPLAIAKNETRNFDKKAVSPKGASGPMQLMPATARQLGVKDIFDPTQNVEAGVRYAKEMLDLHKGNIPNALAAYNAGPGTVAKYGGIPPYKETQDYVRKAMKSLNSRQTQPLRAAPPTPNPFRLNQEPRLPRGPIELLEDSGKTAQKMMPAPARAAAAPAPSPFTPNEDPELPEGPVEFEEPEAPYEPPDAPELPAGIEPIAQAARPRQTGLAAWEPPESAAVKSARERLEEARGIHRARREEGGVDRIRTAVQAVMGKRTDYSELEAAIAELTQQAERSMHPSIGQTLRQMGFALLASQKPFGQALGEAGLHATGVMEKQRQEARANYIAALKAGIELQGKKSAYDEKAAQLSLGESRVRQAEIESARREAATAQKEFDKVVSESPSAQMEARTNSIKQWRASNGQPVDGPFTEEEQDYIRFGTKPGATSNKPLTRHEQMFQSAVLEVAKAHGIKLPEGRNAELTDLPVELHDEASEEYDEKLNPPIKLSPDQVKFFAQGLRQGQPLPPLGRGKQGRVVMQQVLAEAAEQGAAENKSLALTVADGKADANTLKKRKDQLSAINAFEGTALANYDLMLKAAKPILDSGAPWINKPLRGISTTGFGDAELAAFNAARQVALTEIAKITSNPNLTGQLTDSARHEVMSLIPQEATLRQIVKVGEILKQDMGNRKTELQKEIESIEARLNGKPAAPAAAAKRTAMLNGREIYAKGGAWYYKDNNEKVAQ